MALTDYWTRHSTSNSVVVPSSPGGRDGLLGSCFRSTNNDRMHYQYKVLPL
jgi:hypothetical protein